MSTALFVFTRSHNFDRQALHAMWKCYHRQHGTLENPRHIPGLDLVQSVGDKDAKVQYFIAPSFCCVAQGIATEPDHYPSWLKSAVDGLSCFRVVDGTVPDTINRLQNGWSPLPAQVVELTTPTQTSSLLRTGTFGD